MKAQWRDWPSLMKAPLKPFYWISTDDPLLREEALISLRAAAIAQGYEREIVSLTNANDWHHFEAQRQNFSLFTPKPFYECHMTESKFKDGIQAQLHACSQTFPGSACIAIVSPKIESSTQKTKWFEALLPHVVWLPLWPLEGDAFQHYVLGLAKQANLQFTADAWSLFLAQCSDLLSAKQTLLRLSSLPVKTIDVQVLQDYLPDTVPCEVFDLTDAALKGDAAKTISLLEQLNTQSDVSVLILWALTRDIETLIGLKANQNPMILPKRKSLFMNALKRLSDSDLSDLLKQCARCDRALKGGHENFIAQDLLVDVCVGLAGCVNFFERV